MSGNEKRAGGLKIEDELQKAFFALEVRHYDLTIEIAQGILKESPENSMAFYLIALAYASKKMFRRVLDATREALRLDPTNAYIHALYATALAETTGQYAQAEAEALIAIEQDPSLSLGHVLYALMLVKQNKELEQAREYCYKGLELCQGDDDLTARCHTILGRIFAASGKIDEAETEYQLSLSLNPEDDLAHTYYGLLLLEQRHDQHAAFKHFKTALSQDPDNDFNKKDIAEALKNIDASEAIDDPLCNLLREA